MVRLGDVLDYEQPTKYIVQSTNYNDTYKIPVLTAGQSFILGYTNENDNIFTDNLPVIIFDDFTTAIKFVNFPFKVKSSAMKILKARSNANIKYLYYYMSQIKTDTELHKRYWISMYSNIPIPLPPLPVQQKIADVLDQASALIEKRKAQIEKLDLLVKAQFVEMFGDPVTNPMGWEMKPIKDFATVRIGPFGNLLHADDYIKNGIPIVNPSHIIDGKIVVDHNLSLTIEIYEALIDYSLQTGDVVLGRRGEIGRCAVVDNKIYLCGTGSMFIRIQQDYLPLVLQRVISSDGMRKVLENEAVGVTMMNLNAGTIANLNVIIPPLPLQTRFADFVQQVDETKNSMQKGLEELELGYKALMQGYFG